MEVESGWNDYEQAQRKGKHDGTFLEKGHLESVEQENRRRKE
jgi:hypothetical protein